MPILAGLIVLCLGMIIEAVKIAFMVLGWIFDLFMWIGRERCPKRVLLVRDHLRRGENWARSKRHD